MHCLGPTVKGLACLRITILLNILALLPMIQMLMKIGTLLDLGLPSAPKAAQPKPEGFDALLNRVLHGSPSADLMRGSPPDPPGGAPPPGSPLVGTGSEELKTQEPNAQSIEPDLTALSQQGALMGLNALSLAMGSAAPAVGVAPVAQSQNDQVQAFVDGLSQATPAPVAASADPTQADAVAFNKLISAPELGIKMIRVDQPIATEGKPAPEALIRKPENGLPVQLDATASGAQATDPKGVGLGQQSAAATLAQTPAAQVATATASQAPVTAPVVAQVAATSATTDISPAREFLSKATRTYSKGIQPTEAIKTSAVTETAFVQALQGETEGEASMDSNSEPEQEAETDFGKPKAAEAKGTPTSVGVSHAAPVANAAKTEPALDSTLRDRLITQVSDRIEALAATRQQGSVTINLNPLDLGEIKLVLHQMDGRVDAQVYAQDERVRHALQVAQPGLSHSLDQRGIKLEQFQVSTMNTTPDGSNTGHQAAAQQQQQPNTPRFTLKPEPVRATTLVGASRGVDLTV